MSAPPVRSSPTLSADAACPTVAEIAERSGMTEDEVNAGMEALDSYATMSLDAELPGAAGQALLDTLGHADPSLDTVVDHVSIAPCLRVLPEREQQILYLRFFDDMTQSQIAEIMGISQMHVSRLISRTCAALRAQALSEA